MEKKKVLIVCALGMSSSLLAYKTQEIARERNIDIDIDIESAKEGDIRTHFEGFSLVLLGPQIRHMLGKVKKAAEGKNVRVEMIDMANYGRMDGDAVLDQILKLL